MPTKHINKMLLDRDYEGIWEYLSKQKNEHYSEWSKDEKLCFWLSTMERETFSESGNHGILGSSGSFEEALIIFDAFKKLCQRLEWWPEMEGSVISGFMSENGISPQELVWTLNAYTLDPEYVLGRIRGTQEIRDLFYHDEEREKELVIKWDAHRREHGDENICFITCCNNDSEIEEMNAWIDRLWIPEGMKVERLEIRQAPCICAGYNEAMRASDSKYKVYLHQDLRILNPYFIFDLIDCFDRNPKAGMIGMFGAEEVPQSGVMWQARRFGAVIHSEFHEDNLAETFDERVPLEEDYKAALTDGFLMATCVDIEWREDVFKGWDFYDASQSMEFTKKGYEIIIPIQDHTWCLHDFGQINWDGYENSRQLFVKTYLEPIGVSGEGENCSMGSMVKEQLTGMVGRGDFDTAYKLISDNLRDEIPNLKNDAEYCVLVATTYLQKEDYDRAFDIITIGLLTDNKNYELYLILGEYYLKDNLNQALLCFYQALLYCEVEEDRNVIESYIEDVVSRGASIRQISIVIVTKNQSEYLKRCLDSIVTTLIPDMYEIIVVDNASTDGTQEWMSEIEGITYCRFDEDQGYTKACNSGIKLGNSFNDVFLLDADAMLIDNTLFYLMLGMYSAENVGVIGGVTNEFINHQKVKIETNNFEEAVEQANTVNCPMCDAYERILYVSDHAMLISRKAIDNAGILDERFYPDQYADKDYCVRVNMAGLQVLLCMNSYVFKFMDRQLLYGNKKEVADANREAFRSKWGCNIDYSTRARNELLVFMKDDRNKPIEVLELGCSMGATLSRIKRMWPKAGVHGVEYVDTVARIAASMNDVIQGDVENMEIPYKQEQFDYIICADVLEHLRDPEGTIKRFMPYLKKGGHFIISLPNVRHFSVCLSLALLGRFDYADEGILDSTHLRFFTLGTAQEMIERTGLKIEEVQRNFNGHPEDNELITKLKGAIEVEMPDELKVYQYYFFASK